MKTTQKQINQMRVKDLNLATEIDQQETRREKRLTFVQFCKRLEYRSKAVYFNGLYLFAKVNSKMNQLNEELFYNYLKDNQPNLLTN